MAEHLARETIERYRAGALPPDRLLDVDDHLAACDECRTRAHEQIDLAASSTALFNAIESRGADAHCTYETLEAFVDGTLPADARLDVLDHVQRCMLCTEDLGDLRHARALLSTELGAPHVQGVAGLWTFFRRHRWMALTGGALAGALAVWLVFVMVPRGDVNEPSAPRSVDAVPGAVPPPGPPDSPQPAPIVARLVDGGGEVVLREGGEVSGLASLPDDVRQAVSAAMTTRRLPLVATAFSLSPGTLRSEPSSAAFAVTSPVGRVVESDRPTFSWAPHPSARAYRVGVFDSSFREIASSAEISATEWVPSTPLPRSTILIWQVSALTPQGTVQAPVPPAPEARFSVLERAQADAIAGVRRIAPASHLALAVLYARAGMPAEAQRELSVVLQQNPDSPLARDLAASVQPPR